MEFSRNDIWRALVVHFVYCYDKILVQVQWLPRWQIAMSVMASLGIITISIAKSDILHLFIIMRLEISNYVIIIVL